jgi:hypothetical protein
MKAKKRNEARGTALKRIRTIALACGLGLLWAAAPGLAQENSDAAKPPALPAAVTRDGQHDFDFSIGVWKTHIARRQHPLTGSTTWVAYDGTSTVRKIWDGRGSLGETEADGPAGHLEALSLRLYDPRAHQWNLTYASGAGGVLSVATTGEFKDGRGEFFDTEPFNGRIILVRNVWSGITADSCHFEQAFSPDGGKTWEVNWIATDTRVKQESGKEQ